MDEQVNRRAGRPGRPGRRSSRWPTAHEATEEARRRSPASSGLRVAELADAWWLPPDVAEQPRRRRPPSRDGAVPVISAVARQRDRFDPHAEASRLGIEIVRRTLPRPVQGLYYSILGIPVVILTTGLTSAAERCVLAEEIGHHVLTTQPTVRPYFSLADSLKVCREEGRVLKWVADQLVDDVELRRLLRSGLGLAEIADHFDVIPDLITFKCRRLAWG